jgi:hypothetical protein
MTTMLPAAMLAEEVEQTLETPIPISAGRSRGPRHPRARLFG